MRVALSFPACHRRGGIERVMVESLNFLDRRGHEVHAFAGEWDVDALRPGVHRHDVRARSIVPGREIPKFRDASAQSIAAIAPDVIGGYGAASAPGSVVWMTSVHAAWIDISRRTRPFAQRLKQRLNPFHPIILRAEKQLLAGRRYRRLIALTQQVRDDLQTFYDVPLDDIDVLANGFNRDEFNPASRRRDRAAMRAKLNLPEDAKVVVFVANEAERKGLPQLLRAVARLDEVYLLAVGRFDPGPSRALADSLGLAARVQFPGASGRVADFYAAGDVFALPTQYEAWGLVIVEALACGLPVLTSRLAGAAVAVNENVTGALLDDPRDENEIVAKLRVLLFEKPAVGDEAISQSVEAYDWNNVLARYEEILQRCAG